MDEGDGILRMIFFFKDLLPRNLTVEPENDGFPSSESPNFQGLLFR